MLDVPFGPMTHPATFALAMSTGVFVALFTSTGLAHGAWLSAAWSSAVTCLSVFLFVWGISLARRRCGQQDR